MVALVLEKRLAYLFLIVNAPCVRIKLRVVRRVPVSLQVLGLPGRPGIDGRRLTCGAV